MGLCRRRQHIRSAARSRPIVPGNPEPKVETRHRTSGSVSGVAVQPGDEPLITAMAPSKTLCHWKKNKFCSEGKAYQQSPRADVHLGRGSKPELLSPGLGSPNTLTDVAFSGKFDSRRRLCRLSVSHTHSVSVFRLPHPIHPRHFKLRRRSNFSLRRRRTLAEAQPPAASAPVRSSLRPSRARRTFKLYLVLALRR